MTDSTTRISPLARVELEALEAGREWTRRKLERDLQKLADQEGGFSPRGQCKADPRAPAHPALENQRR
jgi:hypothetical protein